MTEAERALLLKLAYLVSNDAYQVDDWDAYNELYGLIQAVTAEGDER